MKTIRKLQAENLAHATCDLVGLAWTPADDSEAQIAKGCEAIADVDRYLHEFTPGPKCPGCGAQLGGWLGTFRWGICTGEGACARCGYPARAQHQCTGLAGRELILPYHPDYLAAYRGSPEYEAEKEAAEAGAIRKGEMNDARNRTTPIMKRLPFWRLSCRCRGITPSIEH